MGIYDRDYMRRDYIPKQARRVPPPTKGMPYWRIIGLGLILIVAGVVMAAKLGTGKGRFTSPPKRTTASSEKPVKAPERLDVNSATYEQLRSIPFMTEATASSLIKLRPFKEWSELDTVYGIGPKRLEVLRDYLFLKASPDTQVIHPPKTNL